MRICYVADASSIHTQRPASYFAKKGHEVHVISWCPMLGGHEGIHVHALTRIAPKRWIVSRYLSAFLWVLQTRRLIHKIDPDIVDGHYITVSGFLAACSGFRPLVVTAWGSDALVAPGQKWLSRFAARYALKKATVVVSLFPVDVAVEQMVRLGADRDKVRSFPLGVNTAEFAPSHRDRGIRQALGVSDAQPIVISTRALAPIYDVETLIKAIPLVLPECPQAAFVIIGTGEQQGYLRQLARDLGVSNATKFVGWVPRAEFTKYLTSADIYVSSSLSDGASVSLLEAMACQLPPVVTDIPANRPWIVEGENGLLFPVGDHRTLASKIIYLLNNQKIREDFGRRSREIVREKAEHETEMGKLEELYRDLIRSALILKK